ncbi:MAG: RimK family alpha-L-glutamate ligase [Candidatus Thermoplasmatota archaeon]|nr:RimK family alpha-L-glutamate ligase [Candidatus Thermoplasmatota archaeon]
MNSENGTSHVTNDEPLNGPIYNQSKILESIKKDYSSILGIFVDRQEISNSQKLNSLIKFRDVAEEMRHDVYFIFPAEIEKIAKVDALFIRSRTDPMNVSFVASKMAEFYGIPVIDDPYSIQICSDKINMYYHLMNRNVSIPKTIFVKKNDIYKDYVNELFKELGSPLIFKEPSTSFSLRVEKVYNTDEFVKIAKRFIKLSDRIVAQEYIESQFDWRIGVLNGRFLYGCKYIMPSETFKIQATINGHVVYCAVKSAPKEKIPMDVIDLAIKAANSIGKGLYGVDLKEANDTTYVIEVNDNPSLESGELDYYPNVYREIISYLTGR